MRVATLSSALFPGIVPGLLLYAQLAAAQPVIEVVPTTLELPFTTLGDTASTSINIANRGDALLTVDSVDLPPGVELNLAPPFALAPDSVLKVRVSIALLDTVTAMLRMGLGSDDPATPTVSVEWENRGLAIQIETLALGTETPFPIGEPIFVESVPLEGVRVEQMTLYFRSGLMETFVAVPMTENVRAFIGVIPGVQVQEGGVEYYVSAENSGFIGLDPAEGEQRPFRIDIGSPQFYLLNAVPRNPGLTWRVGEAIDFMLTLGRGTVFQSGTLWFRAGGDTAWSGVDILEMSFTGIAATIPGSAVGPSGVQYWSEVTTLTTRMTDPNFNPEHDPYEIRVSIDNLVEPETHPAERYRLFSAPVDPPAGTGLAAILSDQPEFGAYDPSKWRAFRYLPWLGTNLELSSATGDEFDLAPARGFWLISRAAHRVNTTPIPVVSTVLSEPFAIVLEPGWNVIGNPFNYPIPWSVIRRSVNIRDPVAFDPVLNDYSEVSPDTLQPFEGYFVENANTVTESLLVSSDPRGFIPPPRRVATRFTAEPGSGEYGWRLEARAGGSGDLSNRVGVSAEAALERDVYDDGEPPPPPGSRVRLAIANHGWSEAPGLYRRDFRPPAAGHSWELEVTNPEAAVPVEIVIRPFGEIPVDHKLRLLDREQGSSLDLVPGPDGAYRYTILASGPDRPYRLTLFAGSVEFVDETGTTAGLPDRMTLDPVVPNPARGALRLRFGLPRAAPVRLDVFDVAGQRVATLLDGAMTPGFHAVVWEGTRDGGERAPSGMYYFRLATGPESRVVRAVMIR